MWKVKYLSFEKITVLILFVALVGTFYRYQRLKEHKAISESRTSHLLEAIFYADELEGRVFPSGIFKNVSTASDTFINFKGPTVTLLFTLSKCELCLGKEMEFLKKLWSEQQTTATFDLIGISVESDQHLAELRKYKKIKQINFPLFVDPSMIVMNWIPKGNFPLVLLIGQDRKIIRAHFPVVDDRLLVEKNYQALERFLMN